MNTSQLCASDHNPFFSGSLEDLVKSIHADGRISILEFQRIRDDADKRLEQLIKHFQTPNSSLSAFMQSMDVTMQLLQMVVLQAKQAKLSDTGEAMVRDAILAQVEYLRAGANLAARML